MAEGMALALEKKDEVNASLCHLLYSPPVLQSSLYSLLSIFYLQEWLEKMADMEKVSLEIYLW